MAASLLTPLHLAASLLALFAAAGLAIVVLTRPGAASSTRAGGGERTVSGTTVAVGALLLAVGHGLAGSLVTGLGDTIAWLRAAGLVLIAVGLSRGSVAQLSGTAVLVPVAPASAAAVGAIAGAVAGLRMLLGGWGTALAGLGLLAWGAAEAVAPQSASAAAGLTVLGSVALGAWLWQASARRILAKFVTAFVATLLAVVVVIAGLLSGVGSADLVREELRRLQDSAEGLAQEVGNWPEEAVAAGRPFREAGRSFLRIDPEETERLDRVYRALFTTQDFFMVVDANGDVRSAYSPAPDDGAEGVEEVVTNSLRLTVSGSPIVQQVVDGDVESGHDLVTVGGRVVAFGAVPVYPEVESSLPGAALQEPPVGALVTGRVADNIWARGAAGTDVAIVLEAGGEASVASEDAQPVADRVVASLGRGTSRESLTLDGEVWYAAAVPIGLPDREPVARMVALSTADVIAQLERDQVRRLFLLALFGGLFAGAVAAVVTGRLVSPIRRLTRAAAAVREGDLQAETAIDTRDEVGQLGQTFNEMTVSLAAQSAQLREAVATQARLRARMEALTSSMEDALVAVDADGKVITFNPAAERLVGRDVADVLGLPLDHVLHGRGAGDASPAAMLGAPDSEDVVAVQLLLESRHGEVVPTAATAAPVRDGSGQVLGRVLVLRDVTREAEIERMKTEFLSNVSHELRTPLTPIKGYADVLARRDVGPESTRRFASQILASTDRLERIVQMIVDFAALDSGRMQLKREPVALSEVVGEALDDWRVEHPEREFRRRVASSLPPVLVDPDMLRRCLNELLDNAVKFSPGGEAVSVTAGVQPDTSPAMVRLSVRDRGVGIEPDTAVRIFSDFYQVDASETRHYGGLGLGLALVRRIVDALGGDASVESRPDRGSTVHLLLPVAEQAVSANGHGRPPSGIGTG